MLPVNNDGLLIEILVLSACLTKAATQHLVGIDLKTNKAVAVINLSELYRGKHFANDITIDDKGNKYITDSYTPVIYKVNTGNHASVYAQSELFKSDDIS